jgi:outer membrane protein
MNGKMFSALGRRILPLVAGALFIPLPCPAAAQTAPLGIGRAVDIALHNNPGLKQTANDVASGKVTVAQSRANFLPDLQFNATGTQQYDKKNTPGKSHSLGTFNSSLSSGLNLFNGFGDVAALKGSQLDLLARSDSLSRAQQSLVFTTASQFLTVATDTELIQVQEENLQANRRQLEQIDSFYKAGNRPISDLYQQQAATSSAELSLLQARRNLQVDKLQLLATIGLAPATPVEIAVPKVQDLGSALGPEDLLSLTTEALARRLDVRAQKEQSEVAREQVRQAAAGYWPALDLVADLGSNYSSLNGGGGFSSQFFDDNPSAAVGLNLNFPLFDRNLTRNNVAQARIQQENAHLALEQLNLQVGAEVGQALQDVQTAQKQVEVSEAQVNYARQALDAVQERYGVGAATLVDLLQARTQYLQASSDRVNARYGLMTRSLGLAYAQGDGDHMKSILLILESNG